jgi:hypothetical protein
MRGRDPFPPLRRRPSPKEGGQKASHTAVPLPPLLEWADALWAAGRRPQVLDHPCGDGGGEGRTRTSNGLHTENQRGRGC